MDKCMTLVLKNEFCLSFFVNKTIPFKGICEILFKRSVWLIRGTVQASLNIFLLKKLFFLHKKIMKNFLKGKK